LRFQPLQQIDPILTAQVHVNHDEICRFVGKVLFRLFCSDEGVANMSFRFKDPAKEGTRVYLVINDDNLERFHRPRILAYCNCQ